MFQRTVAKRAWTCSQCLRQQQQQQVTRRSLITTSTTKGAAAAATASATAQSRLDEDFISSSSNPASKAAPSLAHDDRTLRQIFDSPGFWADFSSAVRRQYGAGKNAGLLQNRYLTRPEGFLEFTQITLAKCRKIVGAVVGYASVEEYKRIVRDLDRLSDLLCRVIDLSDFMRVVHPDRKVQAAATRAYMMMFEYMNVLNTTRELDEQLKTAVGMREVWESWTTEERTVAEILIRDFSKSAIELPDAQRLRFVELNNEISQLGADFTENMEAATPFVEVQSSKLQGMDPMVVKQVTRWGSSRLPALGMPASLALRTVEDAETRREIYMANRTSSALQLDRLERMLKRRAELAKLSGYESFAHMTLTDKMAKTPEAVATFLDALAKDNAPRVRDSISELLEIKNGDAHPDNFPGQIMAWDRDYYSTRLLSSMRSKARPPDFLSAYFSLGTVFQGLSRMFHRLYGLRLVPRETLPGETWNSDVRRLDVIDDHEGHVAVLYCDLFEREGKSPNPAHFTLRCSRRISNEEMVEAAQLADQHPDIFPSAESAANDGLAVAPNPRDGDNLYQLPTIALICDFAPPSPSRGGVSAQQQRPTLLNFRELTTLWHEMGHALHSFCGRTALQNVSGTRVAADLAELPSILSENFASAPEVLALYARHWETDAPLDSARVQERVAIDRQMAAAEVEQTILLCVLDQAYHGTEPLGWPEPASSSSSSAWAKSHTRPSTSVYHALSSRYSAVPDSPGTSWQGFFGHLFGYSATYYSYLFDRAIAGKIWTDVFQRNSSNSTSNLFGGGREGGAVDPAAGALFREQVLRHGGGRDGWECVAGALGGAGGSGGKGRDVDAAVLAEGGKGAMEMVGRWGVHAGSAY